MSINFPNSPSNSDRYEGFQYNSSENIWQPALTEDINSFGNVNITSPSNKATFVFNEDTAEWVDGSLAVFPGQVFAYASSTAPEGYLLCDGSQASQSLYPNLFSVIGTLYNNGSESSGNFRLPSLASRVPVELNILDAEFAALGQVGGEKAVTLTVGQLPSHNHTQLPHNHLQNSHDHAQDSHSHVLNSQFYTSGAEAANYGSGFFGSFRGRTIVSGATGIGSDGRTPAIANATATNQNTTAVNQNAGGGQPHNNLQPYVVVQYIIKT
jgi:microcystin-dependent protein